jgi:hypothetical protein
MNCIAVDNLSSKNVSDIWYMDCVRYRYKIYSYKHPYGNITSEYGNIISIFCFDKWLNECQDEYTKKFINTSQNMDQVTFRGDFSFVTEPADPIGRRNNVNFLQIALEEDFIIQNIEHTNRSNWRQTA